MVESLFDISGNAESGDQAVVLRVHVQPGAGRTAVVGTHGDALKVRVAAPPQGGRANEACAELLAETFGLKGHQVELTSGQSSRSKRFKLHNADPAEVAHLLEEALAAASSAPGKGSVPRHGRL